MASILPMNPEAAEQNNILVEKANRLHKVIVNIALVFVVFYLLVNLYIENYTDSLVLAVLLPVVVIAAYLNRRGLIFASKSLNLAALCVALAFVAVFDGNESFGLIWFIPVMLGTLIVFQGAERKIGITLAGLSFILLIILIVIDVKFPGKNEFTPIQLQVERVLNLAGAAAIALLEVWFILRISNKINEDLLVQKQTVDCMNAELRQTISTRDKVTSVISHDVRGPVAMISSALSLISEEQTLSKEDQQLVNEIRKSAGATVELIDNLLYWSGNQSNQIRFNPEPVPLADLKAMVRDFMSLHAVKDIEIVKVIPETESVIADRVMLQCILRNLYSNAVKFTSAGGKITIAAQPTNQGVRISISDTGIGMTESTRTKLLGGEQFSTRGTSRESGYGLGLQLVREFLKFHAVDLQIDSDQQTGSRFYFTLPRA